MARKAQVQFAGAVYYLLGRGGRREATLGHVSSVNRDGQRGEKSQTDADFAFRANETTRK